VTQGSISDLSSLVQTSLQSSSSGGKPITNLITSLMNTQIMTSTGTGKDKKMIVIKSPLTTSTMSQYLPELMDQVTTTAKVEMTPRINAATASQQVLSMLPGLTSSDVTSLVSAQQGLVAGDPANYTGAWMITKGGLSVQKFAAISQYVTGTSMLYRVQALGYYSGTETQQQTGANGTNVSNWPMARMEALIDTNLGYPRIVYLRDLSTLDTPRGFTLPLTGSQP
jgi:hypothetical protein